MSISRAKGLNEAASEKVEWGEKMARMWKEVTVNQSVVKAKGKAVFDHATTACRGTSITGDEGSNSCPCSLTIGEEALISIA